MECLPAPTSCISPGDQGEPELSRVLVEHSGAYCTSGTCTVSAGSVGHGDDGTAALQEHA